MPSYLVTLPRNIDRSVTDHSYSRITSSVIPSFLMDPYHTTLLVQKPLQQSSIMILFSNLIDRAWLFGKDLLTQTLAALPLQNISDSLRWLRVRSVGSDWRKTGRFTTVSGVKELRDYLVGQHLAFKFAQVLSIV